MHKRLLILVLLFPLLSGCSVVRNLADRGAAVVEYKLKDLSDSEKVKLADYLADNGGSYADLDLNGDGEIDPKELVRAAIANPTAKWWFTEEFWTQILALMSATFGWRAIRKFRNKNKE